VWRQVPARDQALFQRIRVRPPIAEMIGNQCAACHVTVTSSGMQALRKGDVLVQCENCGRILVVA
jgi:predicted  nucleic acid-binding Zn-ribbon protein